MRVDTAAEPAFAEWPTAIEGMDDARALFAGLAPCVQRADGRVECIYRGERAAHPFTVDRNALLFADVHGDQSHRDAVPDDLKSVVTRERELGEMPAALREQAPLQAWTRHPTPFDPPPSIDGLETAHSRVEAHGGCAILEGGRAIVCWGSHGSEGEPLRVDVHEGETAVEVAISSERAPLTCSYGCLSGEPHACARLASGRVMCWGWNFVGQLGDGRRTTSLGRHGGDPPPILDAPVLVEGISDATQVAVGMHHSCALRADRSVACWGYGLDGQLGDGGEASQPSPVPVIAVTDAIAISAGERHTCALLADRRVACWGDEAAFGVRRSRGAIIPMPQLLDAPEPLIEVAAGGSYTCARAASRRVYCGGWY